MRTVFSYLKQLFKKNPDMHFRIVQLNKDKKFYVQKKSPYGAINGGWKIVKRSRGGFEQLFHAQELLKFEARDYTLSKE